MRQTLKAKTVTIKYINHNIKTINISKQRNSCHYAPVVSPLTITWAQRTINASKEV